MILLISFTVATQGASLSSPIVQVLYKQILPLQEATGFKWRRQKKTGMENSSYESQKPFLKLT